MGGLIRSGDNERIIPETVDAMRVFDLKTIANQKGMPLGLAIPQQIHALCWRWCLAHHMQPVRDERVLNLKQVINEFSHFLSRS